MDTLFSPKFFKNMYVHTYTLIVMHHSQSFSSPFSFFYSHTTLTVRIIISVLLSFLDALFTSDSLFPTRHGFGSPAKKLTSSVLLLFLLLPAPNDLAVCDRLFVCMRGALTWAARGFRGYTCFSNNNRVTSCNTGNRLLPSSLPLCDPAVRVPRSQGHFQRTFK